MRSLKFLSTEQFVIRDISFNTHMELIADEIEINLLFHQSLPSMRCRLDISPDSVRI